jgi:ABC-type multidrug transport system fused ATPase/permease subunit
VENADRIFVLADGKIVQEGIHADLIAQNGPYRNLYEAQSEERRRAG